MSRLILVPQYPAKLRYQEWWFTEFPKQFGKYFDDVIVLGERYVQNTQETIATGNSFAPIEVSIFLEIAQVRDYNMLILKKDDILLLCDLSYPGLFANVLFHKRPSKCFAICHATSKNRYDYFAKDRKIKYPIEKVTAKLFDKIFVATNYHKEKLGWNNLDVEPFPNPPFPGLVKQKEYSIVSVSRPGIQKQNKSIEKKLLKAGLKSGMKIERPNCNTWLEYYEFLAKSRILLITSKEETYGYQVVDAIKNKCTPLAPNNFSYPELLSKEFLYNNFDDLLSKLNFMMSRWIIEKIGGYYTPTAELKTEFQADAFYKRTSQIMLQ